MIKTNAMRILDQKKIKYVYHEYDIANIDAVSVANSLGEDINRVFKTLVTKGTSKYYVFMIPSHATLDLKKCAKYVGEKSVEMIKQKDLEPLTGYVHGGCSPIGMKKLFKTMIDETAISFPTIIYSAGVRGMQVETNPHDLEKLISATFGSLTKGE